MCPICLASLAVTVAATTGSGAAATALALRVKRSLTKNHEPQVPAGTTATTREILPRQRG